MSKSYFFRGVHLTEDELDSVLMGAEASVFESVRNLHLKDCAECRAKLAEMRAMLGAFREGVELWEPDEAKATAKMTTGVLRLATLAQDDGKNKSKGGGKERFTWIAVPAMGLAAVLAVGVMVPRWMQERRAAETAHVVSAPVASVDAVAVQMPEKQVVAHASVQAPADDALMQQVQQQLDEDVPSSMAPLTALIQTEDPHQAARQSKEN